MINENGCIPYVEGSFVNIKYLLSIFCGLLSSSVIANQSSWSTSIAVGASRFTKSNDQTIIISDYITDSLVNSHQKTQATYSFSFQRNVTVDSQLLKKYSLDRLFIISKPDSPAMFMNSMILSFLITPIKNLEISSIYYSRVICIYSPLSRESHLLLH